VYEEVNRAHRDQDERDAAEIALELENRYKNTYRAGLDAQSFTRVANKFESVAAAGIDSNIFVVKCAPGKEREIVFECARRNILQPNIMSCFYKEGLKGFVYVEARTKAQVVAALHGIQFAFLGLNGKQVNLLTPQDASTLLIVKKPVITVKVGQWVRMRRGKYEGDLAKVEGISEGRDDTVTVRLVPRVEVTREKKKKTKGRPPARLVDVGSEIL
jgi:transcription elongation factor SPT5